MAKLNREQAELLEAFEAGKLNSVGTMKSLGLLKSAAKNTAVKDKRINIRLSTPDLERLQVRALQEGLPYQTLIASILHKYAAGTLEESRERLTSRSSGRVAKPRAA
jgi:predicted DNA binding CopG/RHH family protein